MSVADDDLASIGSGLFSRVRFHSLELHNFLSYQSATLDFGDLIALVGPNASGKSNAVAAIRLLRDIPAYGLATAIARRGGFDQLRHRSRGRPYDPGLKLRFGFEGFDDTSEYEIQLGAVKGGLYRIKHESAIVRLGNAKYEFRRDGDVLKWSDSDSDSDHKDQRTLKALPGQSALSSAGFAGYITFQVLQQMQTVEINPAKVADLQEPSSTQVFESDGSNTTSVFETLDKDRRAELVDQLSSVVPGIVSIEIARLADRQTLRFKQQTGTGVREFYAKQMSDGTLRAFAILLAMLQPKRPALILIEEPEIAIHLGALRTMVDLLEWQSEFTQFVITTHSADIVDSLPMDSLRVVWNEGGASRIARVADHTMIPVRNGLITPGQLLRSDALDPAET